MAATAVARKLKVFQAQFGFYDFIVAAPSQTAALRAWGIHQDLFASGEAEPVTDPAAFAAATAHPETPLRRAVGSSDAFALKPTSLPKVPDAPKAKAAKPAVTAKPEAARKPPADRSKLDSAEKALKAVDERRKDEEADFRREEEALEMRRKAAQTALVVDARTAYRKAGGAD